MKLKTIVYHNTLEHVKKYRNSKKKVRHLELGPGSNGVRNHETANVYKTNDTDYIVNVLKKLPFKHETFDSIYASHLLEHIPWYLLQETVSDWTKALKPNGALVICVPDGLKLMKTYVDAEIHSSNDYETKDGWNRLNALSDPALWISGRLLSYGDEKGETHHYNWHRAIFSQRFLTKLLGNSGLIDIRPLTPEELSYYNNTHGWVNLGLIGYKNPNPLDY